MSKSFQVGPFFSNKEVVQQAAAQKVIGKLGMPVNLCKLCLNNRLSFN